MTAHTHVESFSPPTSGLNIVPFAVMAGGWLAPLAFFWLYVWGPMRPFDYTAGPLLPGPWFLLVVFACMSLWWLMPRGYFTLARFERSGRLYRLLGVRIFRRFVPDGDLANRWERWKNPAHRVIANRGDAVRFVKRTKASERGHLVLLALGAATAAHASAIGWHGWALYLSVGNLVANGYPILLQRYTRSRLCRLLERRAPQAP